MSKRTPVAKPATKQQPPAKQEQKAATASKPQSAPAKAAKKDEKAAPAAKQQKPAASATKQATTQAPAKKTTPSGLSKAAASVANALQPLLRPFLAGPAVAAPVSWEGLQADNDGHIFAKTSESSLNPQGFEEPAYSA